MNVLLNLQWLIGGMRDDKIRGKNLFKLCKLLIDRLTEVRDLLLIAHVDRQGDCTAALPLSSGVLPRVIVQISGGSLIAGKNLDQIPQINGSSSRGLSDSDFPNSVSAFELAGRIDDDLSLVGLECASRRYDVAGAQDLPESCGLESVLSQAVLRIFQIDHLGQQASPLHFRGLWRALHGSPNQIRKVIEIGVAVLVSRNISQLGANIMRITDDDWRPTVRMQIGPLQLFLKECFHEAMDTRIIFVRNTIDSNKTTS